MKFLIIIAAFLFGCKIQSELPIDNEIILINAGLAGRNEISIALDRIAACRTKVVGINLVFPSRQEPLADIRLAKSIKNAGNVVLVSLLKDDKIISSDSLFTSSALAQGLINYGFAEDGSISAQMLYTSIGDDLIWSFPTTLASYFDINRSDEIMRAAQGNQFYKIDYKYNFRVVDIGEEFNCALMSDKIVIIGYLGPGNEDLYLTSSGQQRYSTWILGNCLKSIQEGHFEKRN
ncbi:MAG: CHASE2 domain-containing protein [Chryseolinea sp.]